MSDRKRLEEKSSAIEKTIKAYKELKKDGTLEWPDKVIDEEIGFDKTDLHEKEVEVVKVKTALATLDLQALKLKSEHGNPKKGDTSQGLAKEYVAAPTEAFQ